MTGPAHDRGAGARHSHGDGGDAAPPSLPVPSVAVVGLGLVGGSLARALKELDPAPRVVGLTRDPSDAEAAAGAEAVDRIVDDPGAFGGVDLVVYAVPLSAVPELLADHAPYLRDAFVTDVASLKAPVVEAARALGLDDHFVGGHPMAGGAGSGFGASRARLFRGARVHLCDDTGSPEARQVVETFWRALEARPSWIGADAHDRRMVWLSHLPQLTANALGRVLEEAEVGPEELGPGGRDMTRLAASSTTMWRDLVSHAAALDAEALRTLARSLEALAADLDARRFHAVEELMERTREWRRGGRTR